MRGSVGKTGNSFSRNHERVGSSAFEMLEEL